MIDKVVARAYYWRHPEQLLLGCLADPSKEVRSVAADRILAIRQAPNQILKPPQPASKGRGRPKKNPSPESKVQPIRSPISNPNAKSPNK